MTASPPEDDPTDPDEFAEQVGVDPTPEEVDHYVDLAEGHPEGPRTPVEPEGGAG